jgi:hypothetical protein
MSNHKEKARRIFSLSTPEILYIMIIVMLGVSIFFTASLIDPLHRLGDELAENQNVTIGLAKRIVEQDSVIIANQERIMKNLTG